MATSELGRESGGRGGRGESGGRGERGESGGRGTNGALALPAL
jgi:hypothetical protein